MAKVLVVHRKASKLTAHMAHLVQRGAEEAGASVIVKTADQVEPADMTAADAIVVGSPCYLGSMDAETKAMFDRSYSVLGQLEGKVGGAFSSAAHIGGGNETALMSIYHAMLVHGMIIQGDSAADHYGPVAICQTDVDEEAFVDDSDQCRRLGRKVATLAEKIKT